MISKCGVVHFFSLWISRAVYKIIVIKFRVLPCPFCLYNKKNITRRLEDMNFIFSWQKQYCARSYNTVLPLENKIHTFAPPCNILSILLFSLHLCCRLSTYLKTMRRLLAIDTQNYLWNRLQNSPYFRVFKDAQTVKQKVWNEAENDFFTDFQKKTAFFAVCLWKRAFCCMSQPTMTMKTTIMTLTN